MKVMKRLLHASLWPKKLEEIKMGENWVLRKRSLSSGVRGKRELKGLVSSINYDSREDKQKRITKGGTMLLTQ